MAQGKIELEGIDQLMDKLRSKMEAGANRVENRGLRAGGEVIANSMKQKVNRSSKYGAGYVHMQDDIRVSGVRRSDGKKFVLVGPGKKTGWRAHFLEYGTKKMAARPFAYPAFHERKGEAAAIIAAEFRKGLREG